MAMNNNAPICSQPFPCVASIWCLSGVTEPCEGCAARMEAMRRLLEWKPIMGRFWMSCKLTKEQSAAVLDEINRASASHEETAR